ncbi:MAG: ArsC/Spx/MgsR family protein [Pseudomonadota bacterium]|nr:ArsC/Spx/MgsR family protein [Pseudomonadota bacterium]
MKGIGMQVYGIKSCDTVRKAMKELANAGHDPVLHDVRETPLQGSVLQAFFAEFGEALVNKRSTTWRELDDEARAGDPVELIAAHPTLMKRPVVEEGDRRTLGWDQTTRAVWL